MPWARVSVMELRQELLILAMREGSNEIRVVLWLDLRRKMPWHLSLLNRTLLLLAELDPNIRGIRKNAVIKA